MTEEQGQSAHFLRQISNTSDDSVGTTSSIKFLMSSNNKKKPIVFTSSGCSKILLAIGLLVIIAIISSTVAIVSSKNDKGNSKCTYCQVVTFKITTLKVSITYLLPIYIFSR